METEREPFECSKLGGTATIYRIYDTVPGTGVKMGIEQGCNNCWECGIARKGKGFGQSIHWEECVHPDLRFKSN